MYTMEIVLISCSNILMCKWAIARLIIKCGMLEADLFLVDSYDGVSEFECYYQLYLAWRDCAEVE